MTKQDEKLDELIIDEIKSEIYELEQFDQGSEQRAKAVDDICKLYKIKIENDKIKNDYDIKITELEMNNNFENKKSNEQNKDRYVKIGITVAEIVLPLLFYGVWMTKGFKFEENGTYTSTTFRNLFNHFRPTKR